MKIKKIACLCLSAITALCLTACGKPEVAGDQLINNARSSYTELDSACVVMTNTKTDEVEQTFTFKYDEKDVLTYSYYGKSDSSEYAQYNNGIECMTYENGEYSYCTKGDKEFSQYTRKATHPQADEGMIIFEPSAVTDAKMTEENGITHIVHIYDAEEIGATAENGEVTGFSAEYFFDENENLMYFVETTNTEVDGEKKDYSYKIEITQQNSVEKVEDTTKPFKK